jgi:hypothetical protein
MLQKVSVDVIKLYFYVLSSLDVARNIVSYYSGNFSITGSDGRVIFICIFVMLQVVTESFCICVLIHGVQRGLHISRLRSQGSTV